VEGAAAAPGAAAGANAFGEVSDDALVVDPDNWPAGDGLVVLATGPLESFGPARPQEAIVSTSTPVKMTPRTRLLAA
jgi:hypothetical protein